MAEMECLSVEFPAILCAIINAGFEFRLITPGIADRLMAN
jgi:hypothetical protein